MIHSPKIPPELSPDALSHFDAEFITAVGRMDILASTIQEILKDPQNQTLMLTMSRYAGSQLCGDLEILVDRFLKAVTLPSPPQHTDSR